MKKNELKEERDEIIRIVNELEGHVLKNRGGRLFITYALADLRRALEVYMEEIECSE